MRFASSLILVFAAGASTPGPSARADVPVLVELFTSEGCSSCPPADATLARVLARPPEGVHVIGLGAHVDYWDELGWKDRFGAPAFRRRQEAYVRRFGLTGPYTPQLVANGRIQLPGGDERKVRSAIAAAAKQPCRNAGLRVLDGDDPRLELEVRADWDEDRGADVWIALLQDHAQSRIARGENAGRTLEHVSVLRTLVVAGSAAGRFHEVVRVPRIEGVDRAVVIVQEPDGGPVRAVGEVAIR